jgi:SPP1 family phage portal protein
MPDITKPNWFKEIPDESEHMTRIMNIVEIKQYLLRQHKILQRKDFNFKEETYKTAKTVINSLKSIINFHVAYTIGKPLEINGDSSIVAAFNKIIKRGGYSKVDYELVSDLVKYGNAYEYIYVTPDNVIKSKVIAPEDSYPIYDDSFNYVAFLEYWDDFTTNTKNYIVYYPERVEVYRNNELIDSFVNLSGLPIHYCGLDKSEFNHFGDSSMNDLIPIMDSIEKLLAKLDDAITTLSLNPIGISSGQSLRDSSINKDVCGAVISLEDGGQFTYANAMMDYSNIKLLLETYMEQLYTTACVPASLIGSSSISNISEVSLKLMLLQTENRSAQNIQVLREGIYQRLRYFNKLAHYVGASEFGEDVFDTIEVVFTQNRPQDTATLIAQMKTQYDMGCLSKQTILDVSPFVVDSELELKRIENERQNEMLRNDSVSSEVNEEGDNSDKGN